MTVIGIDIGSATGKAVVLDDHSIVATCIVPCTPVARKTAELVVEKVLESTGIESLDGIQRVVSTGYGRIQIPFAHKNISEITCHARGAHWAAPSVRTVIDIGGQDCKVMTLSDSGSVLDFVMNDRCAGGTGRFFESMARALSCGLEGISSLENQGPSPCRLAHQCSVFSESEVITLVSEGEDPRNIIAGLNIAIAGRLTAMVHRVGMTEDVAITGGCSKNEGLVKALESKLHTKVLTLPVDPQIAGALGAALFAADQVASGKT